MRRICLTIVSPGFLLLLAALFWLPEASVHAAQSSEDYKSAPIKIERPEKAKPEADETQKQESTRPSEAAEEEPRSEVPQEAPEPQAAEEAKEKPEDKEDKADKTEQAGAEKDKDAEPPKADEEAKAKQPEAEDSQEDALGLIDEGEDLYSRKGRVDPFAPFVQAPEPDESGNAKKKLQRREPRTPLERISLGQLRLTAIMEMPDQNLAMVEEASGKGYVVKEGTYIGDQGGRITEVLPDAIIVEEKYLDVFGKVSVRKKQLKLQK